MESADNTPIRGLAFGDFVLQKLMIYKLCSNRYVMCSKTVIIGNFKRFYTVMKGGRRIRSNPTIICGSGASDFPPKWFRSHSLSSYFLSSFLSFFPFLVLFVHLFVPPFLFLFFLLLVFSPKSREGFSPKSSRGSVKRDPSVANAILCTFRNRGWGQRAFGV